MSPIIINTTEDAMRFEPQNRQCYREDEFNFNYLPDTDFRYQMSNCLFEALVQKTIDECNCIPLALGSNGFNLSMNSNISYCYGKSHTCEKDIFSKTLYLNSLKI